MVSNLLLHTLVTGVRTLTWGLPVVLALALNSCTLFTHYTTQMRPVTRAVQAGDLETAQAKFPEKRLKSSRDRMCYLLEQGSLAQLACDYEKSNAVFSDLSNLLEAEDARAGIAVGKAVDGAGSLMLNDKVLPYVPEPFERIHMRVLQSLNYLMTDRVDQARAGLRLAYEQAKQIATIREKEIAQVRAYAQRQQVSDDNLLQSTLGKVFSEGELNELKRHTADPYQSAFACYLSAVVSEIQGEFNNAYIYYALAHEINPAAQAPVRELARTAALGGLKDRAEEWEKQHGPPARHNAGDGTVIVLLQNGMVAHKQQIPLILPVPIRETDPNTGKEYYVIVTINLCFPRYQPTDYQAGSIDVAAQGKVLTGTEVLTDMNVIALQNFYDRLPYAMLRLGIRATVKAYAAYKLRNKMNQAGKVDVSSALASAALAFTEQADLRSWLLAPATLQVARCELPAGDQSLDLILKDKSGVELARKAVPVKIEAGKITLLNLRAINGFTGEVQVSKPL